MKEPIPYQEERPWGGFRQFTHNENTTVKILTVHPDHACSLQRHAQRAEFWKVLSGDCVVSINGIDTPAQEGEEFWIPQGATHRLKGGSTEGKVLEIAFGNFDEGDIERLEDNYGRI